jgi:hypothetical protein
MLIQGVYDLVYDKRTQVQYPWRENEANSLRVVTRTGAFGQEKRGRNCPEACMWGAGSIKTVAKSGACAPITVIDTT